VRQLGWFGYDAALDGDDIVIVYDQETYDAYTILNAVSILGLPAPGAPGAAGAEDQFSAAEPPPLAPGLTEPLPAPDEDDLHVLRFLRVR
jgi:hypothetical protein